MMKQGGADTWYFITTDYAFGHALEADTSAVVKASGGQVLGAVRAPLNSSDFSSFILQAQASKAKVVGLANAGADPINAIKTAAEFGLVSGGTKLAGLLVLLTDIHTLGLKTAQGLMFTEAFYWDQNDETRAFSKRFAQRHGGNSVELGRDPVGEGAHRTALAAGARKDQTVPDVVDVAHASGQWRDQPAVGDLLLGEAS
jgi:branched-chain amino acid transport system substrate-binding protein